MPVVGPDSADGVWDASPVASIQCCDVQITRKRNKLRGRSANPTITASPIMYKTRGNDHRGVRSSATNIIAVIANSARVAAPGTDASLIAGRFGVLLGCEAADPPRLAHAGGGIGHADHIGL